MAKADNNLVSNLFETLKRKKISVPKFSNATGIPKDRVYKWKYEGTNPKSEDEKIITGWLAQQKMENVPRENGVTSKNTPVSDFKPLGWQDYKDKYLQILEELHEAKGKGQGENFNFDELSREIRVTAEMLSAVLEILVVIAGADPKKAVYSKTVEILKKHKLEGSVL